jgi:hypothetical protein
VSLLVYSWDIPQRSALELHQFSKRGIPRLFTLELLRPSKAATTSSIAWSPCTTTVGHQKTRWPTAKIGCDRNLTQPEPYSTHSGKPQSKRFVHKKRNASDCSCSSLKRPPSFFFGSFSLCLDLSFTKEKGLLSSGRSRDIGFLLTYDRMDLEWNGMGIMDYLTF